MFRPKTSVYLLAPMVLAVAALSACSSQYALGRESVAAVFPRVGSARQPDTREFCDGQLRPEDRRARSRTSTSRP